MNANTLPADSEIQTLSAMDPREAFPYYFEGEDCQDELNEFWGAGAIGIGAATESPRATDDEIPMN